MEKLQNVEVDINSNRVPLIDLTDTVHQKKRFGDPGTKLTPLPGRAKRISLKLVSMQFISSISSWKFGVGGLGCHHS